MKTERVELNLEESGWLCHLVMQQILQLDKTPTVQQRAQALWTKLADANDKLMGKK